MSYSIVYGPASAYNVSATDGANYTQVQLGSNAGAFDSVVSFDLTVTNIFTPSQIGDESLTINFDGDATTPWACGSSELLRPHGSQLPQQVQLLEPAV